MSPFYTLKMSDTSGLVPKDPRISSPVAVTRGGECGRPLVNGSSRFTPLWLQHEVVNGAAGVNKVFWCKREIPVVKEICNGCGGDSTGAVVLVVNGMCERRSHAERARLVVDMVGDEVNRACEASELPIRFRASLVTFAGPGVGRSQRPQQGTRIVVLYFTGQAGCIVSVACMVPAAHATVPDPAAADIEDGQSTAACKSAEVGRHGGGEWLGQAFATGQCRHRWPFLCWTGSTRNSRLHMAHAIEVEAEIWLFKVQAEEDDGWEGVKDMVDWRDILASYQKK
ncbi:hypothetical protein C8R44DRAFT_755416 [Mycena epipterygia]|nr:hypothetical protein C8R44DRAFT_755416 [Mycena epipterygia]